MFLLLPLAFIVSALGAAIDTAGASSPGALRVSLKASGNSAVKAVIKNTGPQPLRLYTPGSLLDDNPIEKTEVYSGCKFILVKTSIVQKFDEFTNLLTSNLANQIPFLGIHVYPITTNVQEDALQTIGVNEFIETEWDPAEVHDLSAGGRFDYLVRGQFLVAGPNSTVITGSIPFTSTLSIEIDGTTASGIHQGYQATLDKRSLMGDTCLPEQSKQLRGVEKICNKLALQAAEVAKTKNSITDRYMKEYFKATDTATRTEVRKVFEKAAQECIPKGSYGEFHCATKKSRRCTGKIYAYTTRLENAQHWWVAFCPEYFAELVTQATRCFQDDQATTMLHEMTHIKEIKGTHDHAYNYPNVTFLTAKKALDNADNYAIFANGE